MVQGGQADTIRSKTGLQAITGGMKGPESLVWKQNEHKDEKLLFGHMIWGPVGSVRLSSWLPAGFPATKVFSRKPSWGILPILFASFINSFFFFFFEILPPSPALWSGLIAADDVGICHVLFRKAANSGAVRGKPQILVYVPPCVVVNMGLPFLSPTRLDPVSLFS